MDKRTQWYLDHGWKNVEVARLIGAFEHHEAITEYFEEVDYALASARADRIKFQEITKIAAKEAYHNEVIETQMEDLIIGRGEEYADRQDWIDSKIAEWEYILEEVHGGKDEK